MSDSPYLAHRKAPKWVRWFVDYAGLAAFLVTLLVGITLVNIAASALAASMAAKVFGPAGLAVAFGAMTALVSSGARIAIERTDGWTRQLRITPLTTSAYFGAKVITGYTLATLTIALMYASGVSLGVSLTAGRWLEMTALIIVALIPFAALGIFLGHLLTADSIGPAIGGLVSLLALVSGTWFPIGSHGLLHDVGQFLPSYWLVRASHVSLGGQAWTAGGWIVVAAWTLVLAILARFAYLRDTARV